MVSKTKDSLQRVLIGVLFGLLEHAEGPPIALLLAPNLVKDLVSLATGFNSRSRWGVVRACMGSLAALASHRTISNPLRSILMRQLRRLERLSLPERFASSTLPRVTSWALTWPTSPALISSTTMASV